MKYLNEKEVSDLLFGKFGEVISSIEKAFIGESGKDSIQMIPKSYIKANKGGDFRAMPIAFGDYIGIKWIGVFPKNPKNNLPTTIGTFLLNDRNTGKPLLSLECTIFTAYRTAATSAIAAKYCTEADSVKKITLIGCGLQAGYHLEAYQEVLPNISHVNIYDRDKAKMQEFAKRIEGQGVEVSQSENVREACVDSDLVTTLTSSVVPYLKLEYLKTNCHVNAIGADGPGKRELHADVISGAESLIFDDWEQASHSGEYQHWVKNPLSPMVIWEPKSLSYVIRSGGVGSKISVFDSTGIAIEDIAVGILIYNSL